MNHLYKTILLSAAVALFAAALYVYRPNQDKLTRVIVTGDAQTKIAPDTAVITFSVVTQNKQALDAQQENARRSEAVQIAVKAATKRAATEIKTSDYSLNPEQNYYSGKMPKILGYEVKNTVIVSISDLSQVGAVIDAATKAGANSVEGISFVLSQTSPAQGDALALATKQAMAKAEAIAESLNGKIARVVETREGGIPFGQQTLSDHSEYKSVNPNASMANASFATPVQTGSLNVRSQVGLIVEIQIGK